MNRGGERGIRTLGTGLPHTRFPDVELDQGSASARSSASRTHDFARAMQSNDRETVPTSEQNC